MSYVYIGNIEDQVTGALHQVTLAEFQTPDGPMELHTRINGTLISPDHEVAQRVAAAYLAWQDAFAGIVDLDQHLFDTEVLPPLKDAIANVKS